MKINFIKKETPNCIITITIPARNLLSREVLVAILLNRTVEITKSKTVVREISTLDLGE